MNIDVMNIDVTDTDYFYMIDNQVRNEMKIFETEVCLPKVLKLFDKSNINPKELIDYPVEGYYYETEKLRQYLIIIRNLQHNKNLYKKVVDCEELDFIKQLCDNDLFGIEDPLKRETDAPLKRRYDILTLTMENPDVFSDHNTSPRPWTIERIMKGLSLKYHDRTNLVELAYLTNDPKCLCCGAESNAMYRNIACLTGSYSSTSSLTREYIWKVSKAVELLGGKIVDEYNRLFNSTKIVKPHLTNVVKLNWSPKLPRVALLGYVLATKEYYHWILNRYRQLTEVYSKNIITTESYEKEEYETQFSGNIFNLTPIPTKN